MISSYIKSCLKVVNKVWGREYWLENQEYCGKLLVLNGGYRCSIHYHKDKKETFFVISGFMLLEIGDKKEPIVLETGSYITINPYTKHRFTGLCGVTEFIEFSTTHSETDSYRDTQSEKVPDEEFVRLHKKYYGPID